jgi:hypothetical protein
MSTIYKLVNPAFIGKDTIEELQTAKPGIRDRLHSYFNAVSNIIRPKQNVTVHYLSDNGGYADTAKTEIKKRLADINATISGLLGRSAPETHYHDTPAQDWRAGAFDLAQISRDTVRGAGNVVFLNCAPRRKERGIKADNEGEGVFIGMLRNGTIISAVSEDSFTFFRDLVEKGDLEIFRAGVQIKGSQFRSRDFFPWLTQLTAFNLQQANDWRPDLSVEQRRAFLEKLNFVDTENKLEAKDIPDIRQEHCIARVDCHGNLKLSLRGSDISDINIGEAVNIRIGDTTHVAVLKEGMFDPNEVSPLGLAFGSSGDWPDSEDTRFLEIALMGKSAREAMDLSDQALKEGVLIEILGTADNVQVLQQPEKAQRLEA